MWWSWHPEVLSLFRRLNEQAFAGSRSNPVVALQEADPSVLEDPAFRQDAGRVYDHFRAYMQEPSHYPDAPRVSYFCMEFGLHECLPTYAGGLGILAGDHAKAASDLGIPFTAVGLFWREGYFEQYFDESGWQQEWYPDMDPAHFPFELVTDESGSPLSVSVDLGRQTLHLQAWLLNLGKTRLYLLDSDVDGNPPELRPLTEKLYQGDRHTRIQQEIVLGIGGIRLLRALGIETDVYHMNEGHCAFVTLEMLRERLELGDTREEAEAWVTEQCVFTTHTPVMAGHDRFAPELFLDQMATLREQLGMSEYDILRYGRVNPDDWMEAFTMTVLALKLSRQANGVSALNGEVARRQWHHMYPDRPLDEVPIGHVTNGIHLPTWAVSYVHTFLNAHFGDWMEHRMDPDFWQRVNEISDAELWEYRNTLRRSLVDFVNTREQSLKMNPRLDPDALTIGFARRFATYKRAPLLFYDYDRIAGIFSRADRPLQVIYAGKAHPADEGGKKFIQEIYHLSRQAPFEGKVVVLENYNMEIGRRLVSGTDVWLNNPRRPMEASGTSGQKVAIHGGLNVSILDGWWPEGYQGDNGWAIGFNASADYMDPYQQDAEDAGFLYDVLESHVIPTFYDRDEQGIPRSWLAYVRRAMATLTYPFSAERMVSDYVEQMYQVDAANSVER